jgi:siderophore synthetase component
MNYGLEKINTMEEIFVFNNTEFQAFSKEASNSIIARLKKSLILEALLTKDFCEQCNITEPKEFLDYIKPKVLESIQNSNDLKIKNIEPMFEKGWDSFNNEVLNSLKNDTLCRIYRAKLNKEIENSNFKSFYDFLIKHGYEKLDSMPENQFVFLQQWASVGHPTHPCHKSKIGMNDNDILNYSPEFQKIIKLKIVAVKKTLLDFHMPAFKISYSTWFDDTYDEVSKHSKNELNDLGFNSNEYAFIPAHPWQVENILPNWFSHQFESKNMILLDKSFIESRSSASFRTMMPLNKIQPFPKVPLTFQITSVLRYTSPAKLYNSVFLSQLIKNILKEEGNYDKTIDFLDEMVSVSIKPNEEENISEISPRHLSVIYRENPFQVIESNELAIPLFAVFLDSPITQKPLIIEIIENHNLIDSSNLESIVREFFNNYAQKAIKAPLGIYLKYGITIECHQQNTILVFKEGVIQRFLYQDASGLDIYKPSFDKTGISLSLHPQTNQYYYDKYLRSHLIHCLFNSHLAVMIQQLSIYFKIEEKVFWGDLYSIVKNEFEKYKSIIPESEWEVESQAFLSDLWPVKALLLMRIAQTKEIFLKNTNFLKFYFPAHS